MFEDIIINEESPFDDIHIQKCILPNGTLWTNACKYCDHYERKNDSLQCSFYVTDYVCTNKDWELE